MFKDGDRVYVPSQSEPGTLTKVDDRSCVVRFDDGSTLPLALDKVTTVPTEQEVAEACRANLALTAARKAWRGAGRPETGPERDAFAEALSVWSKLPSHLAQIAFRMEREST